MINQVIFMSLLLAGTVTLFTIIALRPFASRYGLLDVKDHRKIHIGSIPLVGGISMYIGTVIGALIILPLNQITITWLAASASIVVLGMIDDAMDLTPSFRLKVQVIITLLLSIGTGYYLANLGDLFGFGDIHLGYTGYLVTAFAVIGAINAFNMMDGIDGLAGMMALISFGAMLILFGLSSDSYGVNICLLIIAVITPYLANNLLLPPFKHKIFMGDAGSMFIGFSVVWLLLYGSQSTEGEISFRPVTALWVIAIPLMDMVAIMVRRIRKGQSPFKADRDHLHHIYMRTGFSASEALGKITILSILFAVCGIAGEIKQVPESIMLAGFIILFLGYYYVTQHAWKFSRLLRRG